MKKKQTTCNVSMFNFVMHFIVKKSHDYTFIASAFVENYFQTWIKTHWCPQKYLYHEVSPNVIYSKLPAVPMFSMKERVTEYNSMACCVLIIIGALRHRGISSMDIRLCLQSSVFFIEFLKHGWIEKSKGETYSFPFPFKGIESYCVL